MTARLKDDRQPALPGSPLWLQRRDDLLAENHRLMDEVGWVVQGVIGIDTPIVAKTAYVYSIGNYRLGLPELLMTGSDPQGFADHLNDFIEQMRAGKYGAFDHGSTLRLAEPDESGNPFDVRVVRLDPHDTMTEDWFNGWFAAVNGPGQPRHPVWAYQLVWPGHSIAAGGLDSPLIWPTKEDPWADQPIFGEMWW